jgi:hypothetical protein
MIYNLIIAAILIVAFFMSISAYILGLKHGKQLSNNIIPSVNLNPTKPIIEAVKIHKENKVAESLQNELTDIMNADRDTMLNAIKKGV